jgi:hypothetical protein
MSYCWLNVGQNLEIHYVVVFIQLVLTEICCNDRFNDIVFIQLVLTENCCNDSFNDIVFKHCLYVLLVTIVAQLKNCHLELALRLSSKIQ